MSVIFSFTEKLAIGAANITANNAPTSGQRVSIDETVPGASTNLLMALELDVSQIRGCYMLCDRDVTLKTNSSGSPANTINLKAGIPYIWYTNKYNALLLTTDVTALYVTLAAGAAARLQLEFLVDPTP